MRRNDPTTIWSRLAVGAIGACAAFALTACGGGGDERDATPAAGGDAETTAQAEAPGPSGDIRGCLESAGFTVTAGSMDDELAGMMDITDQFALGGPDDGVGYVTVYGSSDMAAEAYAEEQASEVEGTAIGRVGTTVYTYAGGSDNAAAIDECLH